MLRIKREALKNIFLKEIDTSDILSDKQKEAARLYFKRLADGESLRGEEIDPLSLINDFIFLSLEKESA